MIDIIPKDYELPLYLSTMAQTAKHISFLAAIRERKTA